MIRIPSEEEIGGGFDAGEIIIQHVANTAVDHPIIELPTLWGVNFSVTKHVLILWLLAAFLFTVITWTVQRYLNQERPVPRGFMNALEAVVQFIRDSIVGPNVGPKWVITWTPLVLTFFFFILSANTLGLVPVFDLIGLINRFIFQVGPEDSHNFVNSVLHGSTTVTGNYNVTAALAMITFVAIIVAGARAHGFINHWKNLAPEGMPWPVYFLLVPIEVIAMFVKPFALTMRLAANMTGGHIALLAILSFVFIFNSLLHSALAGIGVGIFISVPMAVGITALEIIVTIVQAYVFTLLSAVFIGMAINVHH